MAIIDVTWCSIWGLLLRLTASSAVCCCCCSRCCWCGGGGGGSGRRRCCCCHAMIIVTWGVQLIPMIIKIVMICWNIRIFAAVKWNLLEWIEHTTAAVNVTIGIVEISGAKRVFIAPIRMRTKQRWQRSGRWGHCKIFATLATANCHATAGTTV